jgi:DNA mismatch endonuclease (patch repair protein)
VRKRGVLTPQGTLPERALFAHLPAKIRQYFTIQEAIPGHRSKPDLIARELMIAVYVDGCRWHGCPEHANGAFPQAREKDVRITKALVADGWMVLRVWEHENYAATAKALVRMVTTRLKNRKQEGGSL